MLSKGTIIGTYEILDSLGAGGMGEVYRANDSKLGREVAIKVLPDGFAGDAERLARFEREAHLLASLNHPNIAAIYDLAEHNGTRFLVMELAPGQQLGKIYSVKVDTSGSTFNFGTPTELFDSGNIPSTHTGPYFNYAISPDGQRFLIPHEFSADEIATTSITVIF